MAQAWLCCVNRVGYSCTAIGVASELDREYYIVDIMSHTVEPAV